MRRVWVRRYQPVILYMLAVLMLVGCAAGGSSSPPSSTSPHSADAIILYDFAPKPPAIEGITHIAALDIHSGRVLWRKETKTPTVAPVVAGGIVFTTTYSDTQNNSQRQRTSYFDALDAQTGKLLWSHQTLSDMRMPPTVDGDTVYMTSELLDSEGRPLEPDTGLIEALDTQTGKARWSVRVEGTPSAVTVASGRLFVVVKGLGQGPLVALDASSGAQVWADNDLVATGNADNGPFAPVLANGLLYVEGTVRKPDGTADIQVEAIRVSDGTLAWSYQTGGLSDVAVAGDTVYTATFLPSNTHSAAGDSSIVAALDAANGHLRWRKTFTASIASLPAATGGVTYLAIRDMVTPSQGSIQALKASDGAELWRIPIGEPRTGNGIVSPVGSGGLLIAGVTAGRPPGGLVVLQASDGKLLWQAPQSLAVWDSEPYRGLPYMLDGILFAFGQSYSSTAGTAVTLYAHRPSDGTTLWQYQTIPAKG